MSINKLIKAIHSFGEYSGYKIYFQKIMMNQQIIQLHLCSLSLAYSMFHSCKKEQERNRYANSLHNPEQTQIQIIIRRGGKLTNWLSERALRNIIQQSIYPVFFFQIAIPLSSFKFISDDFADNCSTEGQMKCITSALNGGAIFHAHRQTKVNHICVIKKGNI